MIYNISTTTTLTLGAEVTTCVQDSDVRMPVAVCAYVYEHGSDLRDASEAYNVLESSCKGNPGHLDFSSFLARQVYSQAPTPHLWTSTA